MSIRALNWAWSLQLSPVHKVIVLALADSADDHGVCWPKICTLARKASVSERTVQRALMTFRSQGILESEARFRDDGSRTSNRYFLSLNPGGDKLSPARDATTTTWRRPTSTDGDTEDAVTTKEPQENLKPPPTDVGGGGPLIFPDQLSPVEREASESLLRAVDCVGAQQLLDELSGRMRAGGIRTSPLGYLRSLVDRYCRGEFSPELALRVAEDRVRRNLAEERLAEARQNHQSAASQQPERTDPVVARERLRELREIVGRRKT